MVGFFKCCLTYLYNHKRINTIIMTTEENEPCDHHWLTDVQLGEYVECELCGLIFLRKDWGKTEAKLKKQIMDTLRLSKVNELRVDLINNLVD